MMETAADFEEIRIGLSDGIDQEILKLKHFMEGIDENTFNHDPEVVAKICERIFYASEGLQKLASVLGFFDCWEESGEPPPLSQHARFDKEEEEESELKDWQKEIMMREGTLR